MARVRGGGAQRWKNNASAATETYAVGINNPRQDWAEATASAESNWNAGIQAAVAEKRFAKGVQKAGSAKWKNKALSVGKDRYAQGVMQSEAAYAQGIAPYLQVIEQTVLPPRFPKGDVRNLERVKAITQALRKKKLEM
jgi:hypothetical protein